MKTIALIAALVLPGAAWAGFDHGTWDDLLKRNVVVIDGGKASAVRYAAFAREPEALRGYLAALSRVTESAFNAWPKPERLAFLINAYNAFTIELMLTRYPDLRSIKDLGNLWRSPWKQRFFVLFGRERSLDDVEHGMIRAEGAYNDPRIHFALNCASVGCPTLRNEAYTGERLDAQLRDATRKFLSDRSRNRIDAATGTIYVSRLFDWYAQDFTGGWRGYGSVVQFLADDTDSLVANGAERRSLEARDVSIRYLEYDGKLNDAADR